MTDHTLHIFAKSDVILTRADGTPANHHDVIGNALNGDAFSWEIPYDLKLTFGTADTAITFADADGFLTDDPFSGDHVADQQLTEAVTVNGTTYSPSPETLRWGSPAPVNVEYEYQVTLFDSNGTAYKLVGISITEGYVTTVVGVMFDGPSPPPGTDLYYIQGVSTYSDTGLSLPLTPAAPCFLAGTRIGTPSGPRPIESLRCGDGVLTPGSGVSPIRWIGRACVDGRGALAPVRIAAGALGNRRDLYVSPNHRILLRSAAAELYFGSAEVLVAAKFLLNGGSIQAAPMRHATYLHLLLDGHRLVFSEGIASESLFAGPGTFAALGPNARAELRAIFPQLPLHAQPLCRRNLSRAEARLICQPEARPTALQPEGQHRADA